MRRCVLFVLAALTGIPALAEMPGRDLFRKGLAGIEPCAECHGAEGTGKAALRTPAVAGQPAAYLAKQLMDFRSGTRASPIMTPIAKSLSATQATEVSAFITALPSPPAIPGTHSEAGRQLAQVGKWDVGVPPCDKCHGPDGRGIAPHFPILSGQLAEYAIDALESFRNDTRRNDALGMMRRATKELSVEESSAVASYYQSQGRKP